MTTQNIQLRITGMTCDDCARTIEKRLDETKGVHAGKISFPGGRGEVEFDPSVISKAGIIEAINTIGDYRAREWQSDSAPAAKDAHLIIVGGGSAAFAATLKAHELGARVTMINAGLPIGGTCVNVGCVPSKNLIRAAETLHRAQTAPFNGILTKGKLIDFGKVIRQKRDLVQTLRQEKYINVVKNMEAFTLIEGRARLTAHNRVEVNGEEIAGDAILIATGATSGIPPIPGLKETGYLTNESAFELEELPEHLAILGGNYIGLENAQLFSRLGSRVSVVELLPQILPTETPDVSREIQNHLEAEGVHFYTHARTSRIYKDGNETVLEISADGGKQELRCSHLLVAAGRRANTADMGLEEAEVQLTDRGFLKVDAQLRTSREAVYGAGDVIGGAMFVYAAAYEGKLAAHNALSSDKKSVDYTALPWVVFTDPQVAGIGLDERQAKDKGMDAETATLPLRYVPRSIAARDMRGFIKLIRDRKTDALLGARIVAPEGSELLMELAVAIKYGITVEQLKEMFHPYLTLSEGIKLAAITFSKSVSDLSCCAT
ncbi:mercuric reductase [bacterium BMS3Bbin03]|nr:mercuric reductase [bacterium BMS3Bbin03]HDZ11212.1 mercury(II) reductase [Bacteroidota bacterium]